MCDAPKFRADDLGRKSRGQKAAVQRRDFALVERAANVRQATFQAAADERCFVGFGKDCVQSSFDVAIRDAATAKFAGDAEPPLAAQLRVVAGVIESVAGIVEIVEFAEASDDRGDEFFVVDAAL